MGLSKIQNLNHKYEATKIEPLTKKNGAQSSIDKKHVPPKDINNQV